MREEGRRRGGIVVLAKRKALLDPEGDAESRSTDRDHTSRDNRSFHSCSRDRRLGKRMVRRCREAKFVQSSVAE